jgi:hypothetical protein
LESVGSFGVDISTYCKADSMRSKWIVVVVLGYVSTLKVIASQVSR